MTISRLFKNILGTSLLAGALLLAPQAAQARVFVSVGFAPPAIPVYEQPEIPGDGYIWTPGYWAYMDDGYEWVDGAWVLAPYTGALWTPGYWGYANDAYFWNAGYWGPSVGYYGGINYGFGYFGVGFYGGYWNHGAFFCNREYNHFGGGYRGHYSYSQRVGNYDRRPGGSSFARGGFDRDRGGSLNHGNSFARGVGNGFGENGGRSFAGNGSAGRVAVNRGGGNFNGGNSFARGANNGAGQNGGRQIAGVGRNGYDGGNAGIRNGGDSFARNQNNGYPATGSRGGFGQSRPEAPARSFGGGGNFSSNLRQPQGGSFQGNAGRSFAAPQQSSPRAGSGFQGGARPSSGGFQGGGGARPSSGGFQGGGGGGFHGAGGGGSHGGHR